MVTDDNVKVEPPPQTRPLLPPSPANALSLNTTITPPLGHSNSSTSRTIPSSRSRILPPSSLMPLQYSSSSTAAAIHHQQRQINATLPSAMLNTARKDDSTQ